jgi:leader peptidase (prepilin peptidase)/N-methyltransferase
MTDFLIGQFQSFQELLVARNVIAFVTLGIFGLIVGSFLSVVIIRLPIMLFRQATDDGSVQREESEAKDGERVTLVAPRSRCGHCQHQLRWFENIPIVSYVFLRAKCTVCRNNISPLYPAVELIACLSAILAVAWFGGDSRLFGALVLSFALIPVAFIDARHFIIPDSIVLPVLWLGLLCNAFEMFVPLDQAVFGAIAGYGVLWSIYWLHRLATGKEGMGHGDFKLAAMLGAWLGSGMVPIILVLAFAGGALIGTGLIVAGRAKIASAIPFGPFLAIAGWTSLYWGDRLIGLYWNLGGLW